MNTELKEITSKNLLEKMLAGEKFTILDVRETWELTYAQIKDERALNIPMSQIGQKRKNAFPPDLLDPDAEIVVMCHHGVRSANVAQWMMQNGWNNVSSLAGGIADYAGQIDPSVGNY
jgi:rhodanese-related sulfurtransferase